LVVSLPTKGNINYYVSILVAVIVFLCWIWPSLSRHVYVGILFSFSCTMESLHQYHIVLYWDPILSHYPGLFIPWHNIVSLLADISMSMGIPTSSLLIYCMHINFWLVVSRWFSMALLWEFLLPWTLLFLLGPVYTWINKLWCISVVRFSSNLTH
jgi:hypothetical protein